MKKIEDGILYLQMEDLFVVGSMVLTAPEIVTKLLQDGFPQGILITPDNRKDFIKASEDPECVKFFRDQDWLLDYNEINGLSYAELIKARDELKLHYERGFGELNEGLKVGRNFKETDLPLEGLNYAITQMDDMLRTRLRRN